MRLYRFLQLWHNRLGLRPLHGKRLFVRGLESPFYELRWELKRLRKVPRVIKGKDVKQELRRSIRSLESFFSRGKTGKHRK